jgi:HK97 family phage prohead protease
MKHKLLDIQNIEFKFDEEKAGSFSGYASVFGGVDAYGDTIIEGAYKKTLEKRSRPVQLRWNHYGDVIGKWTRIEEDEKGLYVEGELTPGHSKAQDVYALLKHGAISGLSIGYRPVKYEENDNGGYDLKEIELVEISVVESPADNAAHVADIKNLDEAKSYKEIEAYLRDAHNLSRSEAVAVVSRTKAITLGEQAEEEKTTINPSIFLDAANQLARRI